MHKDNPKIIGFPQQARSNRYFREIGDLQLVMENALLDPVFQPILQLDSGEVFGYEGLIRGHPASSLYEPPQLFSAATKAGLLAELEHLCCRRVIKRFAQLKLGRQLFLNVSPQTVLQVREDVQRIAHFIRGCGLRTEQVTVELTEHHRVNDTTAFRQALVLFRSLGFRVALDDLGEGFSGLRLWSDLHPDYVKIDMHFVQGISQDPVKFQFLKSLQQIAQNCGSALVAEGVEDAADLRLLRDLGVALAQGFLISRPMQNPPSAVNIDLHEMINSPVISIYPEAKIAASHTVSVERLMAKVHAVAPDTQNETVLHRFERDPELGALPVVDDKKPVGLINRHLFIEQFVRAFRHELHGRKPCTMYMDSLPLVVEKSVTIQELSSILVESDQRYLSEGFIIVDGGCYSGLGRSQDLIREMTKLQLEAARYANPLTMLPGNVPINEHTERLVDSRVQFVAAYSDLNYFKVFNDTYGYHLGDEMIKICARVLGDICDPQKDFLGHIGGDDFIILFQSEDWEARCLSALEKFDREVSGLFTADDIKRGGILGEDRRGNKMLLPLTSLAIGAVIVKPGEFASHLQVATAATEAKKLAKREGRSNLWIERRSPAAAADRP
ncbi:MAG TPA: GGDEF domain-containing protein [Burkholderiales bacterium]|nr:GGDEF domain-containing protein [Burkholderiales bacterium]